MKVFFALAFAIALFCSITVAAPWGHRYATEQPWQYTNVQNGATLRVSVEWGEGGWDGAMGSAFGYGNTTDGSGWTWVECNWFEDGVGDNKRTRTDVTFSSNGTNWYAYRMIKAANGGTTYQLGYDVWSENTAVLNADSYVYVIPEGGMIGLLTAGLALLWRKR